MTKSRKKNNEHQPICKALELYPDGCAVKYPKSGKCGSILRIVICAFRADGCCMIALSLTRVLLAQLHIPQMMPDEILQLDSYGVIAIATLMILLEITVSVSYNEVTICYACWLLMSTLAVNDIVDAMR